jgi:uncharacterized membrane protein
MLDLLREFLELIAKYGVDRVLMLVFFWLYYRSNKKIEKLQDARLADSKEALGALISAKYVLDELEKHLEEVEEKVEKTFEEVRKGNNE